MRWAKGLLLFAACVIGSAVRAKDGGDKNLKIAILSTYPPTNCGIAEFAKNLATSLVEVSKGAVSVEVYSMIRSATEGSSEQSPGVVVHDFLFEKESELGTLEMIAKDINQKKFNALFVQHERGLLFDANKHYPEFLKRISPKTSVLVFIHTCTAYPANPYFLHMREVAQHADKMVALGWKAKHILHHAYGIPKSKVVCFPHGIVKCYSQKPWRRPSAPFTLLMSGIMRCVKGTEKAIEALGIMKQRGTLGDTVLQIVGKDENNGRYMNGILHKAALAGVQQNVKWIYGFQEYKDLVKYHREADVFLAPFIEEVPTSGTILFAMGCGVPVIATPFGFSGELLGLTSKTPEASAGSFRENAMPGFVKYTPYGAITPQGSAESLANAVERLRDDAVLLRAMSQRCMAKIKQITWKKVAQALYKSLCTGKAPKKLLADGFKRQEFPRKSGWIGSSAKDLAEQKLTGIEDGAYNLYTDSFVVINALIKRRRVSELAVRMTLPTGTGRAVTEEETFIFASGAGNLPSIQKNSLLTKNLGSYVQVMGARPQRNIVCSDNNVFVSTPNIVFGIKHSKKSASSLNLVIYGINRFGLAKGLLGIAYAKNFSFLHRNGEGVPSESWKIPNWSMDMFTADVDAPSKPDTWWLKGALYGPAPSVKRSLSTISSGSVLSVQLSPKKMFSNSKQGASLRKTLLSEWRNPKLHLDIPPNRTPRQDLRKQSLEKYISLQYIKEGSMDEQPDQAQTPIE